MSWHPLMEAIYTRLTGDSAITDVVGERIFPARVPQGEALPAVSYFQVFAGRDDVFSGETGLVRTLVQVDSWAESYDAMCSLRNAVRARLARWKQASGPVVQDSFDDGETEQVETGDADGDGGDVYHGISNFVMYWRE